jgi:putative SOS response-associated peptidase YedK
MIRDEFGGWLDRRVPKPAGLKKMFQPFPADIMEMSPVSPMVNTLRTSRLIW